MEKQCIRRVTRLIADTFPVYRFISNVVWEFPVFITETGSNKTAGCTMRGWRFLTSRE